MLFRTTSGSFCAVEGDELPRLSVGPFGRGLLLDADDDRVDVVGAGVDEDALDDGAATPLPECSVGRVIAMTATTATATPRTARTMPVMRSRCLRRACCRATRPCFSLSS
ncbi:hypothetical protein [Jatrophihabitans fulvus]